MTSRSEPSTAPGLALQTLLAGAKTSALKELVDPSIVDTICKLDPSFSSSDRLGELAMNLIEPHEALRDPEIRNRIIRLLPLPKARELGIRLGLKNSSKIYDRLCANAVDSSALAVLYSFFGVVREIRASIDTSPPRSRTPAGYALFEHQRTAATRVIRALVAEPRKVVLHMPTGSGKTRTAMHIVCRHLCQHESTVVCWLAQNAELLDQAADEFEKSWGFLGNRETSIIRFWGHRKPNILDMQDGIIVAGLGKMSALNNSDPATFLRLADRVALTIIDEAHQAIAPTYEAILSALYSKRPRNALLGLTATPGRSWADIDEDKRLSDYFEGQKVTLDVEGYSDPVAFLIEQNYLARPVFRTLNSNTGLQLSKQDIDELSNSIDVPAQILNRLGSDIQRNLKVLSSIEELLDRHQRIIAFAPSVKNARLIRAILSYRGHESLLVTSESHSTDRERAIRRFKSKAKSAMVMVNYGVLTTGFDAPATSAAIIARPTRSLVLYSQMVGRATRGTRAGGNVKAEIVTVVDSQLPGFGSITDAFKNWEDVWNESTT